MSERTACNSRLAPSSSSLSPNRLSICSISASKSAFSRRSGSIPAICASKSAFSRRSGSIPAICASKSAFSRRKASSSDHAKGAAGEGAPGNRALADTPAASAAAAACTAAACAAAAWAAAAAARSCSTSARSAPICALSELASSLAADAVAEANANAGTRARSSCSSRRSASLRAPREAPRSLGVTPSCAPTPVAAAGWSAPALLNLSLTARSRFSTTRVSSASWASRVSALTWASWASAMEGGTPREGAGEGWLSGSAPGAPVRTPGAGAGKISIGFWRGERLRNVLLSFDRDDFSAFRGVDVGLGVGWGEGSLPSSFSPRFTLLLLGVSFGAGAGAPGGR